MRKFGNVIVTPASGSLEPRLHRLEAPASNGNPGGSASSELMIKYRALLALVDSIMVLDLSNFPGPQKLSDVRRAERAALNSKNP